MKSLFVYIFILFIILFSLACGPKPRVEFEPVKQREMTEPPINPVAYYHYVNGVIAELEENYELALSYYINALKHAPDSYDVRIALANMRLGMRDYEKAWEVLEPLKNNYSEAVLMKADCQRALGNWPEAIKYYELSIRFDPKKMASYWYLGNYFSRTGDFQKAIGFYESMTTLSDNPQIFQDLGKLYIRASEYEKAIDIYSRSISIDSSSANMEAYMELSNLLSQTGQIDSAEVVLKNYLSIAGKSNNALMQLIEIYIKAQKKEMAIAEINKLVTENPYQSRLIGQLGSYLLDLNEVDQAQELFLKQVDLDPTAFLPHYYLGRIAMYSSELEKAKSYFWEVIDLVDSVPDGWINLAEVYRMQDSLDMSVDLLREGMDRVTIAREELQMYLSRYYAQKEMYQGVVNILEGLVDSTSTDIGMMFNLAAAYERTDDFEQAVATFKQIIKLEPKFHPALNYLGYMYADSGIHLKEARKMLEQAIAIDTANAAYLDSYGWVLFKMGKLSEAETYLTKAIDLMNEMDAVVYDHMAEIYFAQGRVKDARKIWEKALALEPDNVAIREKLDR